MSAPHDDSPDDDSLEAKLRALAEEIGASVERAVENLGLGEVVERLGALDERTKELGDLAGQWLADRIHDLDASQRERPEPGERGTLRNGPHPLDVPTEDQGLALSALDSGRWKVDPGTEELVPVRGGGLGPSQPIGLVGELRARDWIAPGGEVTLVGRDALQRWLTRPHPS
jgi:hypothetical protein